MRPLVVGVGTAYRRDDGVGPAVAARLSARSDLDVVESVQDAADIVAHWSGRDLVVLVDAVRTGAAPGTVHGWELDDDGWSPGEPPDTAASGHLWGVATAVGLARALDRLPRRLVVVGVDVSDLGQGPGLSPAVGAAVDQAVALVLDVVQG